MNEQTGGFHGIEPPTTARAILYTSRGQLEIEIWAKETPIASRNFLQRCGEGYYDGTTFGRLIRGFIIQGGAGWRDNNSDESGSGGFPDEFHSRLKFNRRGIVGTANVEGVRNSNGSQFIMTLAPGGAPQLDGKNTVFGKLTPQSLYTLAEMVSDDVAMEAPEGEDGDDRPLYPVVIERAEVVEPYFKDLEIKSMEERARAKKAVSEAKQQKKKDIPRGKKVKQRVKVVYDGEDEDGDGEVDKKRKFVMKTPSINTKKKMKLAVNPPEPEKPEAQKSPEKPADKKIEVPHVSSDKSSQYKESTQVESSSLYATSNEGPSKAAIAPQKTAAELNAEFETLKSALKLKSKLMLPQKATAKATPADDEMERYAKASRARAKKGSEKREAETLAMLRGFRARLVGAAESSPSSAAPKESSKTAGEGASDASEDEAGGDLSDEENDDPYSLYAHQFGSIGGRTKGKEDGGDDDSLQKLRPRRFGGAVVSARDVQLIAQDDEKNRRADKYLREDPDGTLMRRRKQQDAREGGSRARERDAYRARKAGSGV